MAKALIVKIRSNLWVEPFGFTTEWIEYRPDPYDKRFGGGFVAHLVNMPDNTPSTVAKDGYEFLGTNLTPDENTNWEAADALEYHRMCDGEDLLIFRSDELDNPNIIFIGRPFPGNRTPQDYGWTIESYGGYQGAYAYFGGGSGIEKIVQLGQAPCKLICDLQITDVAVVDNLGTFELVPTSATTYPPVRYSLDGVNFDEVTTLYPPSEGTYIVYAKDSRDCRAQFPVKVEDINGGYEARYIGTFKDNDNALWSFVIDEKDYEGVVEEVDLGAPPVNITWNQQGDNKLAVIKGSQAVVSVDSKTNMQFLSLFTSQANKYRGNLIKGTFYGYGEKVPNAGFVDSSSWVNDDVFNMWTFASGLAVGGVDTGTFRGGTLVNVFPVTAGEYVLKFKMRLSNATAMLCQLQIGGIYSDVLTIQAFNGGIDGAAWLDYEFGINVASTGVNYVSFTLFNDYISDFNTIIHLDYVSLKPYNDVIWQGLLATEAYDEPYLDPPYFVDFTFYDGLGKLKELAFESPIGEAYTGIKSQATVLAMLLAKTGLLRPINVAIDLFEARMDTSAGLTPLTQAYVNVDGFLSASNEPVDCYTALTMLLSPYGAQVYMRDGEWWVVEVDMRRLDDTNREYTYYKFNAYGKQTGTSGVVSELIQHTAAGADPGLRFITRGQRLTIKPAFKEITVEQQTGITASLNRNANFSQEGENGNVFVGWVDTTGTLTTKNVQDGNTIKSIAYFPGDGLAEGFGKFFSSEDVQLAYGAKGASLKLKVEGQININSSAVDTLIRLRISVGPYYLTQTGEWATAETFLNVPLAENENSSFEMTTKQLKAIGVLSIDVFQAYSATVGLDVEGIQLKQVTVMYNPTGTKMEDPIKTKIENDDTYNFVPDNWKIGFGDILHENAAFAFKNPIYLDKLGTITSEKWYRRAVYVAPPVLINGSFTGSLSGWDVQFSPDATWYYELDSARTANDAYEYASRDISQQLTNVAGPIEISFHAIGVDEMISQDACTLILFVGDYYSSSGSAQQRRMDLTQVGQNYTFQFDMPENAVIWFRVVFDRLPVGIRGIVALDNVTVKNVEKAQDPTFLNSLNGLTIQSTLAEKLMNAYQRPMALVNGKFAMRNILVRMGNVFRDTYNNTGQDFMITYLQWDVMASEMQAEVCEFLQINPLDTWLLTEGEDPILSNALVNLQGDY